jgi:hypothetical protein
MTQSSHGMESTPLDAPLRPRAAVTHATSTLKSSGKSSKKVPLSNVVRISLARTFQVVILMPLPLDDAGTFYHGPEFRTVIYFTSCLPLNSGECDAS